MAEEKLQLVIEGQDKSGPATKSASDGLAHVGATAEATTQDVDALDKAIQDAGDTARTPIPDPTAPIQKGAKDATQAVGDLDQKSQQTGFSFQKLGAAIAATFAIDRLVEFGKALVDVEAEYGKLRASLNTVTDSTEEAAAAWQKIQSFQADAPIYTVQQITEAFIKLKALGLDPSEAALRSYGNTSAAMGKTSCSSWRPSPTP